MVSQHRAKIIRVNNEHVVSIDHHVVMGPRGNKQGHDTEKMEKS